MNPWEQAKQQLDEVKGLTDIPDVVYQKLLSPHVISGELHVGGKTYAAYRSQHNNARGPYKGGIRFHPGVTEEEVKALSFWMSLKSAVVGIPYGGGKGGIIVDPSQLTIQELEALSRAYARMIEPYIGEKVDVPAPDVNTNSQIMAWMLDEYESIRGHHAPGTFTGKPIELGGSLGREEATGMGGVYVLQQLTDKLSMTPTDVTIAIQGIGNVGYWFAKLAREMGYRVVALSDSKGGVVVSEGSLDIDAVIAHKKKTGQVSGFIGAETITNEELLELEVTVLVPAALEGAIHGKNADKVRASCVIEMANGPVTPEADHILKERGIISVPDVLANAGGVTVSYFEWVQNLQGFSWKKDEVFARLKEIMDQAFTSIWSRWSTYQKKAIVLGDPQDITMRQAAFVVAIERIVSAMHLRGQDV